MKEINEEKNREKLFGGIPILLGGDFRQILPVITEGTRQEIVQASISNSPLWEHCEVHTLSRIMRVKEMTTDCKIEHHKQEFYTWLRQVRDETAPAIALADEDEESWIEMPPKHLLEPKDNPIQKLLDTQYLQERAILTPLNQDADEINDYMFEQLIGEVKRYKSSEEVYMASTDVANQQQMYPTEFLNTLDFLDLKPSSKHITRPTLLICFPIFTRFPPHKLRLKRGLPIMLLRNVNPTQGLCNGTRLIIAHLGDWVVEVEIITGACIGNRVLISRINLSSKQTKWPFVIKRRQFPINKSQRQPLRVVGLHLPELVFCHGHLYVALSRVTSPLGLKIMLMPEANRPSNLTKNVVFKEVFSNLSQKNYVATE
ncbi:hypothetical protein V2J09_016886 [Rumex salicifolius]